MASAEHVTDDKTVDRGREIM